MASHLTQEYFGIQRRSWWTQWLQGTQVLWLQNTPKSSALHHRAWQMEQCVCADLVCLFFPYVLLCIMTKHLHFGLVSPENIVPEVLLFVQMTLCCAAMFCLEDVAFFSCKLFKQTILIRAQAAISKGKIVSEGVILRAAKALLYLRASFFLGPELQGSKALL